MLATATTTAEPVEPAARPSRPVLGDIRARLAGVGALGFVAVVVLQNIIRGASAPANGASSDEVLTHYADHRATTVVLVATFVLGGTALAVFLGGAMRRLIKSARSGWAFTGFVGAVGVMTLFAVLVGCEQALSVVASGTQPDTGAIGALWALHNSVFTVLYLSIALALLGLSRAGVAAGITPRVFERLAPVGSGLLAIACVAGPFIAAGEAMALFGLGGIGFLIWLAFLVTTGARLVRSTATDVEPAHAGPVTDHVPGEEQTMSIDPITIATERLEELERAWNRADGPAFGEAFADDSDFVDIRGVHHRGDGVAIGQGHQEIFDSIYAGSTVRYRLDVARELAPGCILAVATSTLDAPSGPLSGTNQSRFTAVITEQGDRWAISAFQNTLVSPS